MTDRDRSLGRREFFATGSAVLVTAAFARTASFEGRRRQELSERLRGVRAMTFDVFGTVVDWRTSITREGEAVGVGTASGPTGPPLRTTGAAGTDRRCSGYGAASSAGPRSTTSIG